MKRKLVGIILVCAAAVALFAMQNTTPRYMDLTGPIPAYGRMHEVVATRLFDVGVNHVKFSRNLSFDQFGRRHVRTTAGLWAVVTTDLAARGNSTSVGYATWVGPTGLRYRQTDRLSLAPGMPPHLIDPGLARRGRFVFEIRPDQAVGATLLVSTAFSPRLDSEAHIALNEVPMEPAGSPIVVDTIELDEPSGKTP